MQDVSDKFAQLWQATLDLGREYKPVMQLLSESINLLAQTQHAQLEHNKGIQGRMMRDHIIKCETHKLRMKKEDMTSSLNSNFSD